MRCFRNYKQTRTIFCSRTMCGLRKSQNTVKTYYQKSWLWVSLKTHLSLLFRKLEGPGAQPSWKYQLFQSFFQYQVRTKVGRNSYRKLAAGHSNQKDSGEIPTQKVQKAFSPQEATAGEVVHDYFHYHNINNKDHHNWVSHNPGCLGRGRHDPNHRSEDGLGDLETIWPQDDTHDGSTHNSYHHKHDGIANNNVCTSFGGHTWSICPSKPNNGTRHEDVDLWLDDLLCINYGEDKNKVLANFCEGILVIKGYGGYGRWRNVVSYTTMVSQ